MEIACNDRLKTPLQAAGFLHIMLKDLRAADPACATPLTEEIESPDWDFQYGGENFFISLFAPFYPRSHSRYSGHDSAGFVLFQPESSFRRFGVSSRHPRRERLAKSVQMRFQRFGQDYDVAANGATPKAMRFVKPMSADEPPIRWWRVPYEAEAG